MLIHLSEEAEAALLKMYSKYNRKFKIGKFLRNNKLCKDSCKVRLPSTRDSFLDGLLSVEDELVSAGMLSVTNSEYFITREGIAYCKDVLTKNAAFITATHANKRAIFADIISIISLLISVGLLICNAFNAFRR
jgi:hypothetical protein